MSKLEQAARQALEALESAPVQYDFNSYPMLVMTPDTLQTTLTALREALAEQAECPHGVDDGACKECYMEQAEQEPVAIIEKEAGFETEVYATGHAASLPDGVFKLYASPVRTKDLSDDEIDALVDSACDSQMPMDMFARAVIAADREKNR